MNDVVSKIDKKYHKSFYETKEHHWIKKKVNGEKVMTQKCQHATESIIV